MLLDLSQILNNSKDVIDFSEEFNFSQLELQNGQFPVNNPVLAKGTVKNNVDFITLDVSVETMLSEQCARCNKEIFPMLQFNYQAKIVKGVEDQNIEDDVIVIDGYQLDLEEIVLTNVILNIEMKYLCSNDCKGICGICGIDLNTQTCECGKKEIDPRLAVLKKLLK